jgi:hypothetical protein
MHGVSHGAATQPTSQTLYTRWGCCRVMEESCRRVLRQWILPPRAGAGIGGPLNPRPISKLFVLQLAEGFLRLSN